MAEHGLLRERAFLGMTVLCDSDVSVDNGRGVAAENWEPEKEVILQPRRSGEGVRVSSRQEWAPIRSLQLMLSFS